MALIGSQSWVEGNSFSPWRTWPLASSVEQESFSPPFPAPPLLDPAAARVQLLDGSKPRKGSVAVIRGVGMWTNPSCGGAGPARWNTPQTPPPASLCCSRVAMRGLPPPKSLRGGNSSLSGASPAGLRLPRCAELSRVRAARSQLARLGCRREGAGWEREEVTWGRTRAGATRRASDPSGGSGDKVSNDCGVFFVFF